MVIQLRLVNQSQAAPGTAIAVSCTDASGTPIVAWRLFRDIAPDGVYPFTYSPDFEISVGDSTGNFTPQQPAEPGNLLTVQSTGSGLEVQSEAHPTTPDAIIVENNVAEESITALVFKEGLVCAQSAPLAQNDHATFSFHFDIFIGVATDIQEGPLATTFEFAGIPTQVNLSGIRSVDIVMSGGGNEPLTFTLEHVHE